MIADLNILISNVKGILGDYYFRQMNGKLVMCKRPKFTKPATEKQKNARKIFAERYAQKSLQNHLKING